MYAVYKFFDWLYKIIVRYYKYSVGIYKMKINFFYQFYKIDFTKFYS